MSEVIRFNTPLFNQLLTAKGYTAESFASVLKQSPETVSSWIKGERPPYQALMIKISSLLGVKATELFSQGDTAFTPPVKQATATAPTGTPAPSEVAPKRAVTETKNTGKNDISEDTAKAEKKPQRKEKKVEVTTMSEQDKVTTGTAKDFMPKPQVSEDSPKTSAPDELAGFKIVLEKKERKPRTVKAGKESSDGIVLTRDTILGIAKNSKVNPKGISKTSSPADVAHWMQELTNTYKAQTNNILDTLGAIAALSSAPLFAEMNGSVEERYKPLLEAAKNASDAGIKVAIDILQHYSK